MLVSVISFLSPVHWGQSQPGSETGFLPLESEMVVTIVLVGCCDVTGQIVRGTVVKGHTTVMTDVYLVFYDVLLFCAARGIFVVLPRLKVIMDFRKWILTKDVFVMKKNFSKHLSFIFLLSSLCLIYFKVSSVLIFLKLAFFCLKYYTSRPVSQGDHLSKIPCWLLSSPQPHSQPGLWIVSTS